MQALVREGLAPQRDLDKAEAESRRLRAAVATLESAARRVPQEQATRDRERDVRLQRLYSQIATLEAEQNTAHAGIERLGYEIERRRVRAPVDARIGESAILRTGAVVQEGEKLASIVPAGRLLVAAQFPPDAAFGRIRPGQAANPAPGRISLGRVRLSGGHGRARGAGGSGGPRPGGVGHCG